MRYLILFSAIILSCTFTSAQNSIKGIIVDSDHLPMPGVSVVISDLNTGTVSDPNGQYILPNLPNGKMKVEFSFLGYSSRIETVILNNTDHTLDITLHETSIEAEEIVVTGGYNSTQHENAVKIDVLKLNKSHTLHSPNFAKSLTKVPGVDMISKGNGVSKPVIRGLSMNDILILNNGVRFENYQYSSHHPMGIDEFGIENIEIIKGPASLLYGSDAIGGVINFIKEKPAPKNSIVGDYNMQLFSNSLGMNNNLGIKTSGKKFSGGIRAGQKSHADYLQGDGDFVPNSRFKEYSIKTHAGYTANKGIFKLYYDYNQQNLGLVEDEAVEEITKRGRKNDLFYQQLNTHLLSSQNKMYLGKMKLDANASYQNTELIHFGDPQVYEIQMKLATLSYESKIYLPSGKNSEYIVGFQGTNQFNNNINNRETMLLPDATTCTYSTFALLQETFFNKLNVQTGVRYDYKNINTDVIGIESDPGTYRPALNKNYGSFSGSLGATYEVSDNMMLRANIASAYRTPNLAELTSNGQHEARYEIGNVNLDPEKSYEADLSIHYHIDNLTFDIAGFYNTIQDYIFITPTGEYSDNNIPVYRYRQENSKLYGGEAGAHLHPSYAKWLHIQASFSSVIGKQNNGDYLPFIPANKLRFELRLEKERLSFLHKPFFSLEMNTAFDQNHAAPDETTTEGYSLLDTNIGATLKINQQPLSITVSATNIFDKKYIDHLSTLKEVNYFNPGRNFVLSIKVPFGSGIK